MPHNTTWPLRPIRHAFTLLVHARFGRIGSRFLDIVLIVLTLVDFGCSEASPQGDSSSTTQEGKPASSDSREILVGGLYASKNEDGTYRITKVLAVDNFAVHIRIYANRFDELPSNVDLSVLTLGSMNDSGGFGIGHAPMAKDGFFNDDPYFIKQVSVDDEELEGYRLYLEAIGGSE